MTGDNDGFRPLGQYRCPKVGEHGTRGRGPDWNDADDLPARAIVCVVWHRRSAERITAALEGGWAVGIHVDEERAMVRSGQLGFGRMVGDFSYIGLIPWSSSSSDISNGSRLV